MSIRPIRTDLDYEAALARARTLLGREDQDAIDEIEVIQALIEKWERSQYPSEAVTAAQAIRFRMVQAGMKPRDLIPYLGTKSRVSEILNGQRQPTIDQIRALHKHLGIPLSSLISSSKHEQATRPSSTAFAAAEKLRELGMMMPEEDLHAFITRAARVTPAVAMLRKSRTERTNAKTDLSALEAWCAAVLLKAEDIHLPKIRSSLGCDEARYLARMSTLSDWPNKLPSALAEMGIALVLLDHLPGTYLDGAAICRRDGAPVIAMTLRHDRLDNFWFTLLHEFAHVSCHLSKDMSVILDDLDVSSSDEIEAQADEFARDALVPKDIWRHGVSAAMSVDKLIQLAHRAGVDPAIVAGRWRYEFGDYRRFSKILGRGKVRELLSRPETL